MCIQIATWNEQRAFISSDDSGCTYLIQNFYVWHMIKRTFQETINLIFFSLDFFSTSLPSKESKIKKSFNLEIICGILFPNCIKGHFNICWWLIGRFEAKLDESLVWQLIIQWWASYFACFCVNTLSWY